MSFLKTGASAIGKLFIVVILAAVFLVGLMGTVYLSLRGEEIKVPEIIGKNYLESEKELEALGLKIKKRADRFSQEKPDTILEQLPKPGDTVKTGQMILVVVSKTNPESTEAPATVQKETPDDTADNPDNSKKTNKNANANVKRPSQTTRDVVSNKTVKNNSNSSTADNSTGTTPKNNSNSGTTTNPGNKNSSTPPVNKSTPTPSNTPKPNAVKTPVTGGDIRPRKTP